MEVVNFFQVREGWRGGNPRVSCMSRYKFAG